jgi:hypothetical protein
MRVAGVTAPKSAFKGEFEQRECGVPAFHGTRPATPPVPPLPGGFTIKRTIEKGDFQKASFLLQMKTAVTSPWRVGSWQVPAPW